MGSTARRTAVGLVAAGLAAVIAPATDGDVPRAAAPPLAHVAVAIMHCGNNGCTESSQLTMAGGGGLGETMTDNIPANATEASVTIAPVCSAAADRRKAHTACSDGSFTRMLDTMVSDQPGLAHLTPGKPATRLVGCAVLARSLMGFATHFVGPRVQEQSDAFTAAVFLTCVGILAEEAGSSVKPSPDHAPTASVAAQRCGRLVQTFRVRFTKSGGKVVANQVSAPIRSTRRLPVSISCKQTGSGLVITLKATRRGQALPKVIGPTVGIGYVNPGPLPAAVKTTFKVN